MRRTFSGGFGVEPASAAKILSGWYAVPGMSDEGFGCGVYGADVQGAGNEFRVWGKLQGKADWASDLEVRYHAG